MNRKKSIRGYLIQSFSIGVGLCFIAIFGLTFMLVRTDIRNIKEQSIEKMLSDASANISSQISEMFATAYTIAADEDVYTTATSFEEKKDKLVAYAESRSINSIGYITADGYLTSTDGFENDISDREYFKNMMNGGLYISNPAFNTATNKQIIFIGVPLYENNKIVGAITCTFNSDYMSELISGVTYLGAGNAYMLSSTGTTIASTDTDMVLNAYNVITEAESDASLKESAAIHQTMLTNEAGVEYLGEDILFYDKVANSEGWTIIFDMPKSVFNNEITSLIRMFGLFLVLGIAMVVVISVVIGTTLGKRLMKLRDNLTCVAEGDFTIVLDPKELKNTDEVGIIYQSIKSTIDAIGETLIAMKNITNNLADQAVTLDSTAQNLHKGTITVTDSVNEIQSGNTEQANEIENINQQMEKFNTNIEKVNSNIGGVVEITSSATDKLHTGNDEMEKLSDSFQVFHTNFEDFRGKIENMNENLSAIDMITNTISEIASQTNLLSLNASIEAARAGEVGRGFAVVAQEIAKLADQCADSIKEISNVVGNIMNNGKQLIDSTSTMGTQIQTQNDIIGKTMESFEELSKEMQEMFPQIENISVVSNDNLKACQVIGDSIQNANAYTEELVATTVEVNSTSESFLHSSKEVNEAAERILGLSDQLSKLASNFNV